MDHYITCDFLRTGLSWNLYLATLMSMVYGCEPTATRDSADVGENAGSSVAPPDSTHFITAIVAFNPGAGAGYGQDNMPNVILGPPQGGGQTFGGLDVLSLGKYGSVTVQMGTFVQDGPGPDFVVFENAFEVAGAPGQVYAEPGEVSVSEDGLIFETFPCAESAPWQGCAGITPVYTSSGNDIDPRDLSLAGGDGFDLQTLGLQRIRYIKITDRLGKGSSGQAGFDLDAIVTRHAESP